VPLHFLTLTSSAQERELERGLLLHLRDLLPELGRGFAFNLSLGGSPIMAITAGPIQQRSGGAVLQCRDRSRNRAYRGLSNPRCLITTRIITPATVVEDTRLCCNA
jgi:hypothetical protein